MNIIIVTGASSGIGAEFVRQIDPYFDTIDEIWLVARSRDKLKKLAESCRHHCRVLAMDITGEAQLDRLEDEIVERSATVRMLINAAGYGIMGAFAEQDRATELGMIRLNCEALTDLTHRLIPYMKRGSRIIQMASCAAFLPQPDFAVYAATKAYVLRFSQALGEELRPRGIYVTSVCPGPVDTPFFDIAERTGRTLEIKKVTMVSAERVVRLALQDSLQRRTKSVCSLPIKGVEAVAKIVPHELAVKVMSALKI